MSNQSLKEQLQSLSLEFPKETSRGTAKRANSQPSKKAESKATKQKPAWLEQVKYGVELLKTYYPTCFKESKEIKPLKIGIKQDLVKSLAVRADIAIPDKACMVNSLSYYVNSSSYHKSVQPGATRIDLEGNEAGHVSQEEATYSLERFQSKMNKKNLAQQKKQKAHLEMTEKN